MSETKVGGGGEWTALREALRRHSFYYGDRYFVKCFCGWVNDAPIGYANGWESWAEHFLEALAAAAPAPPADGGFITTPANNSDVALYLRDAPPPQDGQGAELLGPPRGGSSSDLADSVSPSVGCYVASRASIPARSEMWRSLRSQGLAITSTWIDEAGEGETGASAPVGEPVIRCNDCSGTLMYKKTAEGYEVFHSCKDGKQVREMFAELAGQPSGVGEGLREASDEECRKVINSIAGDWHNNLTNIEVYELAAKYLRPFLKSLAAPAPKPAPPAAQRCPHCNADMDYLDHGKCRVCFRYCGCSFSPTSASDYCNAHRPVRRAAERKPPR